MIKCVHGRSSDLFLWQAPSRTCPVAKEVCACHTSRNLQQRDCSGFSPDSLLIAFPKRIANQCGTKIRKSRGFTREISGKLVHVTKVIFYFSLASVNTNSSPPPCLFLAEMVPPCIRTAFFTMASPRPVPPSLRERPLSTR